MASADDGDIIWEDDDPDFMMALSLFMDGLESGNEPVAANEERGTRAQR